MNVGKMIKTIRFTKNYSQVDLSEKTGISQTSLSKIEKGAIPHQKSLEAICSALDITVAGIYILSIDKEDLPEDKRERFKEFNDLAKEIFNLKKSNQSIKESVPSLVN